MRDGDRTDCPSKSRSWAGDPWDYRRRMISLSWATRSQFLKPLPWPAGCFTSAFPNIGILATGDITLKLNQAAGRDFTVSDLRHQGFDAVLIAVGAHRSRDLTIPGVDLDGVYKGIDFLLNVNLGYKFTIGKKVIVIGGGNV